MQTDAVGESGIGENVNQNDTDHADKAGAVVQDESVSSDAKWTEDAAEDETAFAESGARKILSRSLHMMMRMRILRQAM